MYLTITKYSKHYNVVKKNYKISYIFNMPKVLKRRLIERRKELRLSVEDLASKAGLTRQTIYAIMKGRDVREGNLIMLAKVLQCAPEYLAGETAEESPVSYGPSYGGTLGDLLKSQELLWTELSRLRAELKELKGKGK